jgi:hypothetical protein
MIEVTQKQRDKFRYAMEDAGVPEVIAPELPDLVAGRVWSLDGVETSEAKIIDDSDLDILMKNFINKEEV